MQIVATQKFLRMSPRKLRAVAVLVQDMSPLVAVEMLPYVGKRAAEPLQKVIKTAIANARVQGITEGNLVFESIQINQGPQLKRYRAGSRGRAKPYTRDMSHIRVVLTDVKTNSNKTKEEAKTMNQEILQPENEVKIAKVVSKKPRVRKEENGTKS